jgi:hypothetical protein
MTGFGKRGNNTLPHQETEDDMNVADRFVLSPNFPKYLTMGLMGGVGITLAATLFGHGLPSLFSVAGMIIPLAILGTVVYFSFRGMQRQHAQTRATRKQLAKYPQLYFWGFAGGALAYAIKSGTPLTTLWADLKASFGPIIIRSDEPLPAHMENTFMDMGHWILGGVLLAYVVSLGLDKLKERDNAR